MTIALIILKLIMFAILVVGPVLIGRQLTQAARGRMAPAAAPAPSAGEAEDAA